MFINVVNRRWRDAGRSVSYISLPFFMMACYAYETENSAGIWMV